jgi:hypothetical protein
MGLLSQEAFSVLHLEKGSLEVVNLKFESSFNSLNNLKLLLEPGFTKGKQGLEGF